MTEKKRIEGKETQADREKKIKKKLTLEALEKSLGNVSQACKVVGISRETFYRWKNEDEEFERRVVDIDEANIDFVETSLLKNIREGKETSIIFYLKTKGKKRGYVEKMEMDLDHSGSVGVYADISNLTDEEIVNLARLNDKIYPK